ncbi:hypothetical protein PPERSA_03044 [Pseudocohnilembus persalinus]|uniref:Peptidase S54 rhomboid domain-containing protein n=1 Tax=Pseudocohnilembus persalinus TaxID=266149 RepID=A0A0V0QF93_PSEPJ|nr:hypothetical protein PPERSA_03044 [Pseudocohnilembus persalinus]|eukprot:KRX00784.1 hypothetical protein PPERSA_03044 [Pseudocohnilembus persalinus]
MVGLYFFGKFIERGFGSRALLSLYLGGTLLGGLFIIMQTKRKYNQLQLHIGASAGVASILTFFIVNFPNQQIILYFFPVPAWMVGVLLFGQSIIFYDDTAGVSHINKTISSLMCNKRLFFISRKN